MSIQFTIRRFLLHEVWAMRHHRSPKCRHALSLRDISSAREYSRRFCATHAQAAFAHDCRPSARRAQVATMSADERPARRRCSGQSRSFSCQYGRRSGAARQISFEKSLMDAYHAILRRHAEVAIAHRRTTMARMRVAYRYFAAGHASISTATHPQSTCKRYFC